MRQSHLLICNTAIIWLTRILRIIPELILVPFLIRNIGESGYGVYTLAWSLMVSIEMLEMGLQSGVIKHSAAFVAQKQINRVNKVITTSVVYSITFGIVAGGVMIAAAPLLRGYAAGFAFSVVTVGVLTLLVVPLSPYVGIVLSQQRHYVNALVETTSKYIILLTVVLWFKSLGASIEALMVISAAAIVLTKLVQVPIAYRLVRGLRCHPTFFEWRTFKMLVTFGGTIVLCTLCSIVHGTGVRWLMGFLVSASFVAHLTIILIPGRLLSQTVQAMTLTVMPAASKYEAIGDFHALRELLVRGIRYSFLVVMTSVVVAMLTMRSVLVLWVGPEYAFLAVYALVVFCSVAFQMSSSCAHHMLRGMGKLRVSLATSVVGHAIVPMTTTLVLWVICRQPYVAVTVGISAGNIVCGLMQTVFCANELKLRCAELFLRAYGAPLIAALATCAVSLVFVTWAGIETIAGRGLVAIIAAVMFCAAFYAFLSTGPERQQLKGSCRSVIGQTVLAGRRLLACVSSVV